MSFRADFQVGGKTYRVLKCKYDVKQDIDAHGRPSSEVRAGRMELEVEATSDNFLAGWAFSSFQVEDGKVIFFKRDSEQKMTEVSFKQGHCVYYVSEFDFNGDMPMIERIIISAGEVTVGSVAFSNDWPE